MFENLFGNISRFIQARLSPQPRGTTPQGQAKYDAFASQKVAPHPIGATPEGEAKLDANRQAKQAQVYKPMGYGKEPMPK